MILSTVHSINKYFIPDRYCVDEKLYRKTRIFINTTLITSAISFITIFSASYFGMIHHMYATGICCILFFSLAWLFRSGVSLFVCANLYLLVTFAWCAYVTFYDGALRSPTVPWLALPPVGAFFLLQSTRSGWLFAVLSELTIITFGIIQANNPDYFRSIKEMKDSPGIR